MDSAPHNSAPREKSIWPMFLGAFALFVLFAVFAQWMLRSSDPASFDEDAIRAGQRYEILAKVQEEAKNLTTGYGWADQAKGTVRIPLDRAMELSVAKLSAQGEPRPGSVIDPTIPHASALKAGGLAAPQPTPPPFNVPPATAPATPAPAASPAEAQP